LARWVAASRHFGGASIAIAAPELDQALVLMDQGTTSIVRAQAALARVHRAVAAFEVGDAPYGIALYEAALAQARAAGSDSVTLVLLGDFAGWLIDLDGLVKARGMAQEALRLALATEHAVWLVGSALCCLALVAAIEGDAEAGARRIGAIDASWRLSGLALPPHYQQRIDRAASLATTALGKAAFAAARAMGEANLGDVLDEALRDTAVKDVPVQERAVEGSGLSRRQQEVLRHIVAGRSDRQIAEALFISHRTASHHVAAIMSKLRAQTRGEAAVRAVRDGLI
jgi:DNA-binding CsgD family transcriptional regulator